MKFTKVIVSILLTACTTAIASTQGQCQFSNDQVAFEIKEAFVEVGNGKLFCRVMGQGAPLIIIHGGPGLSQEYLLPSMNRLAKTYQVIFYDQRGCGRSLGAIDSDSITIDQFIEDIEAIRKAFHFEKVSILGHSWGGHLAMQYATHYPQFIDKLILMNSMPASSSDFSLFLKEYLYRISSHMEELDKIKNSEAFITGDSATVSKYFKVIFHTYCFHPENVEKLNVEISPSSHLNGVKTGEILRQSYLSKPFDLTSNLKKLKCKTLIVHGDFDPIPLQTAKNLHQSIAQSKLIVLDNCGHFPYVEEPDLLFPCLERFLMPDNS